MGMMSETMLRRENYDPAPPLTYPTGFGVTHVYSANGYMMEVRDTGTANVYWQAVDRDAEGHVIEEILGNGLTTRRDYDPNTGRLQAIATDDGAANTVQDLRKL
jgi:YD repeat-containing protein